MTTEQKKMPLAVIAGAGIAGLAAAWWLSRAGWRAIVVEKATDLRNGGHMMGLSGPGLLTARHMDIVSDLQQVALQDHGEHLYKDRRGREILRLNYRELLAKTDWITLRRTSLVDVLYRTVASRAEIRMSTTVRQLETRQDGVDVVLSDGTALHADLLIGADGLHSEIRRMAFGQDANRFAQLGYRYAVYDVPAPFALSAGFESYAEPGLQTEYYAIDDGRVAVLHVWRSEAVGRVAVADRLPLLRRLTQRSHPSVTALLDAVPDGEAIVMDDLTMVEMPTWHNARVLLLGDAAHSLSLISGQGAGMALASAQVLAQMLQTMPIDQALDGHHARLRPVIEALQARSRKLAPVFVPASATGFALRNTMLKLMPGAMLKRYFLNGLKTEQEAAAALFPQM